MELSKFLVRAKKATYANAGEGKEKVLDDRCKELIYEEENFSYRDRYFGFNPFSGQEIVWQNSKILWSMNYYGKMVSDVISAGQIYDFLKKALKLVPEEKPFRGPSVFKENEFEYLNENEGTVESFKGRERILYKRKEVFKLDYHGGYVK